MLPPQKLEPWIPRVVKLLQVSFTHTPFSSCMGVCCLRKHTGFLGTTVPCVISTKTRQTRFRTQLSDISVAVGAADAAISTVTDSNPARAFGFQQWRVGSPLLLFWSGKMSNDPSSFFVILCWNHLRSVNPDVSDFRLQLPHSCWRRVPHAAAVGHLT